MLRPAACLLLVLAACLAEEVTFRNCNEEGIEDVGISRNCTVHTVMVNPCREALDKKTCRIVKGRTVGISFTYTPDGSADELVGVASSRSILMNGNLRNMDTDACHFTTCPVTGGTSNNYTFNLAISKLTSLGKYDVMWKLRNKGDERKFECCFLISMIITARG